MSDDLLIGFAIGVWLCCTVALVLYTAQDWWPPRTRQDWLYVAEVTFWPLTLWWSVPVRLLRRERRRRREAIARSTRDAAETMAADT